METTLGAYNEPGLVLPNTKQNPYTGSAAATIPEPDTSNWYTRRYGCLRTDPTLIASRHTFPDAALPIAVPPSMGAPSKICLGYRNAWPLEKGADPVATVEVERNHPTFAFHVGAPTSVYQIDVESQLRRLDQPLTNCQAVLAEDSPLYRNTVKPPAATDVPRGVRNAGNPDAAILRSGLGADACRMEADAVASAMSGRPFHNPTRQDTQRFVMPFSPPGVGTGAARPAPVEGRPFYS